MIVPATVEALTGSGHSTRSSINSAVLWPKRHKNFRGKIAIRGDRAMPSVLPSSVADAKLAEKKAWKRYAEARDDN